QGMAYIIYRGWGDATGWHYPRFHKDDLEALLPNPKTSIVLSIVCNTGDFANPIHVECFGEYWMHMGSPSNPKGCVAFVGPSDLHTRTALNNSFSSGIVDAICNHGERSFGAAVLNGKVEIYNNFPMERHVGGYVPFYNHIYAILSDPSLRMWYGVPELIADILPDDIDRAVSSLEIDAPGLDGAVVTGTKDNENYTYTKVINGRAILPIDVVTDGDLTVTISRVNMVPLQKTLVVSESTDNIAVISNTVSGSDVLLPGEAMEISYTLKNLSANQIDNVTATLTSTNPEIATISGVQNIGSLAANAEGTAVFSVTMNGNVAPRSVVETSLAIAPTNTTEKFSYQIGGAALFVSPTTSSVTIGGETTISVDVMNTGTAPIDGSISIRTLCDAATIDDNTVDSFALAVGESVQVDFQVEVNSGCTPGRSLPFAFVTTDDNGYETTSHFSVIAGIVDNTAPTGPDTYGYYAYDNNDTSWTQAPTYDWYEIDPRDGGPGTVIEVTDDMSVDMDLPFTFRYYGIDYNSITACSNGWISFIQTWMSNFDNLFIPAALGPYAMVAPYWEDLKGLADGSGGYENMRLVTWHDTANNRLIIEWNDAYNRYTLTSDNPSLEKFQLILEPNTDQDGDLVVMYHTVDNPSTNTLSNHSTVGIENHTQNGGLTYSFSDEYPASASPLQAGLAVRFTTTPPDAFVGNDDNDIPVVIGSNLSQNYPNPFNPETTINFNLKTPGRARLDVYNQRGQHVTTLVNGNYASGLHSIVWNGRDSENKTVASGIYLYKLQAGTYTKTRKMILIK
ncbi:MAG: C25 family cysteine peptidase, partial [Candidatus Zophobacter franzmannii]|nr:C25 family cysteine peptidase [Candidatus Zophobacter franzmannii]